MEALNALPEAAVREICGQLAVCAEEGGLDEADGLSDPREMCIRDSSQPISLLYWFADGWE